MQHFTILCTTVQPQLPITPWFYMIQPISCPLVASQNTALCHCHDANSYHDARDRDAYSYGLLSVSDCTVSSQYHLSCDVMMPALYTYLEHSKLACGPSMATSTQWMCDATCAVASCSLCYLLLLLHACLQLHSLSHTRPEFDTSLQPSTMGFVLCYTCKP